MKRHALFSVYVLVMALPIMRGLASSSWASSMLTPDCESTLSTGTFAATEAVRFNLCRLIEKARLDDLEWPDFPNYREQVQQFYSAGNYALAWVSGNQPTSQALALIDLFQHSDQKGLVPQDYDATRWEPRLREIAAADPSSVDEEVVRFDLALTVSAMRYISDLHNGRVSPARFHFGLEAKTFDIPGFLRGQLLAATAVPATIEEIEPRLSGYQRTVQAYAHYLALANEGEGAPIPAPSFPLKAGDTYGGLAALAERLERLGDLAQNAVVPSRANTYGGALVAAVRHFQQRHGLAADGRLTQDTYDQLVTPFSHRASQLQFKLERFRWLPANLDSRVIVVNIPEFRLRAYEDHRVVLTMKAIVGEALDHRTPVFADRVEAVVFRPYWNVPESITKGELVAELRKHPGYLVRHGMQVVDSRGNVITDDQIDAKTLKALERGALWLRQQPGPANALGLVKFVFPNQYGIYMHGTPETGLFNRVRRDLSHGCVRVEDPAALAAWVLRDDPAWKLPQIDAAMSGEESISVKVPHPLTIFILYGTAVVDENGEVRFFNDIYGLDTALQTSLDHRHE